VVRGPPSRARSLPRHPVLQCEVFSLRCLKGLSSKPPCLGAYCCFFGGVSSAPLKGGESILLECSVSRPSLLSNVAVGVSVPSISLLAVSRLVRVPGKSGAADLSENSRQSSPPAVVLSSSPRASTPSFAPTMDLKEICIDSFVVRIDERPERIVNPYESLWALSDNGSWRASWSRLHRSVARAW